MLKLNYTDVGLYMERTMTTRTVDCPASPPGNAVRAIAPYRIRSRLLSAAC
ncbi:hypothetical protein JOY44_31090 (plasmid) [Phormidium sp. CLA17]|uniref:hypothetical protein n=1 Tax=Leptolyngbya sp. Cla-17 TaxID=2803751 RepID=UPI0014916196|nr:hypothetical protein [Leptolyngbya sp. Cla-17]MBM0745808.1 hypothetical protein [Leptolyngbya sp. Cla-17]